MRARKRPLAPDPGAERALRILDEIHRTVRLETRPVVLSEEYLRAVEQTEASSRNEDGADKTWVERAQREFREHYARARRVR
jgi:hypothetical protein